MIFDETGPLHKVVQGYVAVVDVEGFSEFCVQSDGSNLPQTVARTLVQLTDFKLNLWNELFLSDGTALRFPDFRKFTGDGLIIIWKEKPEDGTEFGERIVRALRLLQERFSEFIRDLHTENNAQLPNRIRVGISRGGLFPVKTTGGSGDPDDFVGYVINLACRIQTLRCGFVVTEHVLAPLAPERLGMSRILLPDLKGCRARTAYVFPEDV